MRLHSGDCLNAPAQVSNVDSMSDSVRQLTKVVLLVSLIIRGAVIAGLLASKALLKHNARSASVVVLMADDIVVCRIGENVAAQRPTRRVRGDEERGGRAEQAEAYCQ